MDKATIIDTLGLISDGDFSIIDIQMVQWGHDLIFECIYRTFGMNVAPDDPVMFRLVFHDCRDIKYRVYAHISAHEQGEITPVAHIAEISLGKGNHRRDANLLTTHFGVTISYGKVFIECNERTYPLS